MGRRRTSGALCSSLATSRTIRCRVVVILATSVSLKGDEGGQVIFGPYGTDSGISIPKRACKSCRWAARNVLATAFCASCRPKVVNCLGLTGRGLDCTRGCCKVWNLCASPKNSVRRMRAAAWALLACIATHTKSNGRSILYLFRCKHRQFPHN